MKTGPVLHFAGQGMSDMLQEGCSVHGGMRMTECGDRGAGSVT